MKGLKIMLKTNHVAEVLIAARRKSAAIEESSKSITIKSR